MSAKTRNTALAVVMYIFAGLAVWTLLPLPPAAKANDLGYAGACPFAPWSTLALLVVAGLIWAVRAYLITLPE